MSRRLLLLAAALAAGGCGPSTKHQMIDIVPFATARDPYFTARKLASSTLAATDPACPVVTTMGTTTMIEGGCTDTDGNELSGTAVLDGSLDGDWTMTWTNFTRLPPESTCDGEPGDSRVIIDGTASVTAMSATVSTFAVDLSEIDTTANLFGCGDLTTEKTWAYTGTVETGADSDGDATPDELTFDGTGTVTRDDNGRVLVVTATTTAQLMDRTVCDQEPLSGETTLVAGDHTGVVTNDGATDCDDSPTGAFTYDGKDAGEVAIGGVCTVVRVGGSGAAAPAALAAGACLALAALAARARRRRS